MTAQIEKQPANSAKEYVPNPAIARAAGCSLTTFNTYITNGVLDDVAVNDKGKRHLIKSLGAIIAHLRKQAAGRLGKSGDGDTVDIATASAELKIAQTEKTRVEIELKQIAIERTLGNLITREDIERSMSMIVSATRAKFQALPNRLSVVVPTLTKQNVTDIHAEVRIALESLATDLPATVEKQIDAAVEEAKTS